MSASDESTTGKARLFDIDVETVVGSVACTWCGVGVGSRCSDLRHGVERPGQTHAQRWRDYWNATRANSVTVFRDPSRG